MDWSASKRPAKDAIRHRAFRGYVQRAGAIILPGWDESASEAGRCIRGALDVTRRAPTFTSIDRTKPLYCVERDPTIFPLIERDIRALGFTDARFHNGGIDSLPIDTPIDFGFIDMCGSLNPAILTWLRDTLTPHIVEGAQLSFTMLMSARGSDFILAAFYAMMRNYRDLYNEIKATWWITKPQAVAPLFLLRCALKGMDFGTEITEYRDTTGMLFMRFTDAVRADMDWPNLDEVLARIAEVEDARRASPQHRVIDPPKPSLKNTILAYVEGRSLATNDQIRAHVAQTFGELYTTNQIAFALVELQSATGSRRSPGGGKIVKIASSPNTYAMRDHLLKLVA